MDKPGNTLRTIGITICILVIFILAICVLEALLHDWNAGGQNEPLTPKLLTNLPFALAFEIPLPLLSLILFTTFKNNRAVLIHALVLILLYIIPIFYFWGYAQEEAAKDPQGGLIFIFGPIYIQAACFALWGVFSLIYFTVKRLKNV